MNCDEETQTKYVKSQKTGEWVTIDMTHMDYHSTFSRTLQELKDNRMALNKIINDQDDESIDWEREFYVMTDAVEHYSGKYKELEKQRDVLESQFRQFLEQSKEIVEIMEDSVTN
jgi:predicted RNase H-like nuclease (RuvC/YqgF family)